MSFILNNLDKIVKYELDQMDRKDIIKLYRKTKNLQLKSILKEYLEDQ